MSVLPRIVAESTLRRLLLTGLLLLSPRVLADGSCALPTEVHSLIDRFLVARQEYAFNGTLLLEHNNQRQFVTTTSQPGEMVTLQRLNSTPSAGPKSFPLRALDSAMDACDIGDNYQISMEGGPTVAGRSTQRLTVRPRDTLRFGYVMDLDYETALPLRVATATPDGQLLERYEFATIDVQSLPASMTSPESSAPAKRRGLALAALPPGFAVAEAEGSDSQLVVSDGLASASIFLEPLPDGLAAGEGTVQSGSTVTYTRGVRSADTTFLVTVIGEVPVTTARLLASAVRLNGNS
jgi:sigma-E factor negative regulatory protein RseB